MRQRIQKILLEVSASKYRQNINDAFWKWFENSKVVDKNGDPVLVYHGSKNVFTHFDLNKAGSNNDTGMWGTGFYFSPIRQMSLSYGDKLYYSYLSIKNPLIVSGNVSKILPEFKPVTPTHGDIGKMNSDALRKRLISAGYDGVIQYEPSDGGLKLGQIVAFYPTQIKSARNVGTWNPNNPDILK